MEKEILKLKETIAQADTIVIGAGAGLSTSAGFTYTGERFDKHFADFHQKYGFTDMYSGGFYPYKTLEENWAFWSRYIWINRYMDAPKTVYSDLLNLVRDKDYFVLTTNVDHCFQKAGFDKKRLFYTQGDYGLFQCSEPCHLKTYDNKEMVRKMVEAQGNRWLSLSKPPLKEGLSGDAMTIPTDLIPHCPVCGKPMSMNLRADDTFVQDEGWYKAAERYENFIRTRKLDSDGKVLFLELGVGGNTPGIIKYPFWQMTARNHNATYACINFGEAVVPREIADKSICVNADIGEVLKAVQ